jgi:omega-hydroxy-beta-dihydromenaquinone-9 sulfotransferase
MPFDHAGFLRFLRHWLLRLPWTRRRVLVTAAFLLVVPPMLLATRLALRLDTLLHPAHRRQRVREPVFIIGNPRSGTTFLHRLLALDRARFSTMRMWEILLAPSLLQRRAAGLLARMDERLGRPLASCWERLERRWDRHNVMHRVSLFAPEEDDYLLLYAWSALTVGLSSGLLEEARRYVRFDTALGARERTRLMRFYRGVVQRHLYAQRQDGAAAPTYLAKNPALCPKLHSLLEAFPDARIIYLVRNPLHAIPSYVSMMEFSWRAVGVPVERERLHELILEMAGHWYRYPLERLARVPAEQRAIIRYDDLIADPGGTVQGIYRRFGYHAGPELTRLLESQAQQARHYASRHDYALEALDLTRERILAEFDDVFERFGFDRGARVGAAGQPAA